VGAVKNHWINLTDISTTADRLAFEDDLPSDMPCPRTRMDEPGWNHHTVQAETEACHE